MTYKCKKCPAEWSATIPWMLLYVCPKCGSTDTEEVVYLPVGINIKKIEPDSDLSNWVKRTKPSIKKDE